MEHEQAMNGAYKSFRISGRGKTDVKSYITLVKPRIRKLVEEQVKTFYTVKVQMHLRVIWKKEEKLLIQLDDEDMEDWSKDERQAWKESEKNHDIKLEKVFNSRMTEVFQGSNVEEILQGIILRLKLSIRRCLRAVLLCIILCI